MKILAVVLLLLCSILGAVTIGPWSNIRFSGKTAANEAYLQSEIPFADIYTNKLIYNSGSAMTEVDQSLYNSASETYQSVFPIGTSRRYVGLRLQAGTSHENTLPVYYEGTVLPALNQMTRVSTDTQNETSYNYLDITNDYFTFTGTKFYAAIQNRGGGFPLNANFGTVYHNYMCAIAPPSSEPTDPGLVVWAMIYMNVGLVGITPGLYKVTGTSTSDLIRIGNIETQVISGSNLLVMSCNISDLLADADFAAWYNQSEPSFGFMSLTSRSEILTMTTTETDRSIGGKLHPRQLYLDPSPNQLPVLSNPIFHADDTNVWMEVSYSDPEGNFPLTASVNLGGSQNFPLHPQSYDFAAPVIYRTENIIGSIGEYDNATAAFSCSDNNIGFSTSNLNLTYVRGLQTPEHLTLQKIPGNLEISWDPVSRTLENNPVTVSYYRIETSTEPDFATYTVLDTTTGTSYLIPVSSRNADKYYRVKAVKLNSGS